MGVAVVSFRSLSTLGGERVMPCSVEYIGFTLPEQALYEGVINMVTALPLSLTSRRYTRLRFY